MQYKIVHGSLTEITTQVNELMKQGWQPQGGLSCGEYGTYQALVLGQPKGKNNVYKTK